MLSMPHIVKYRYQIYEVNTHEKAFNHPEWTISCWTNAWQKQLYQKVQ